jgi:hypothetical protein
MQASDIPLKLPIAFAQSAGGAYKHAIPVTSQIGITDGAASLTDGFVPLNATPIGAGGVPPSIQDMNGILFEISAWVRWAGASGPVFFDGAFSTAVGGYPRGATLQSASTPGLTFISLADNNTTNPDGGDPSWQRIGVQEASPAEVAAQTRGDVYVSPRRLSGIPRLAASSYGPNGYRVWSDGYVEQWGTVNVSVGSEITIPATFPIPFPTACDNVVANVAVNAPTTSADAWTQIVRSSISTTGFSCQVQHSSAPTFPPINGFNWRASGR